ncbi:MAG: prepilin-type N-terminal cleavage/methylation domain-containing protein [Patescibacteria group bacterium]|jgi:prepilin-type N-terminal cleavage/methylation domain-containing protein
MKIKQNFRLHSRQAGFTLIELIIVIAIIALLAAATFVAVNPAKRIGDANNAQRWADITAIADAWNTYVADNSGSNPTTSADCITANTTCMIANYAGTDTDYACGASTTAALIWLDPLITSGYLANIPADPKSTTAAATSTGYYMLKDANGALTVGACETYNSATIKVQR